ncbi:MAG: nucleotidyltransferase family protein [Chitinophagales bacterium]|nr:nucleotidyltransferase family protein [Chitinophagales bacterium]
MKTREEILGILRTHKQSLMSRYPISSIGLFGSYARNEATTQSDVDVIVEVNGKMGLRFVRLAHDLEDLLEMKVDLVAKNAIEQRYIPYVMADIITV